MKRLVLVLCLVVAGAAEARSHYSGRYGPAHSFSYGHCKTRACFARHPGGTYLHPNTGGERMPQGQAAAAADQG